MKYNLRGRILLIAAVAAFGGVSITSCDKMTGNDGTEYLEDDYVPVTETIDDWSGDYVVAHVVDGKSVNPFAALEGSEGKSGKVLKIRMGGILWGSSADDVKTVLKKADDWSYTMHVAGVGYIGYDGDSGFVRSYTESTADSYLWDVLLAESGSGHVRLCPKTADETVSVAWNADKASFVINSTDTPALLFRRVESTGIKNHPTPPDGGDGDGDGDGDGKDDPQPTPTPTNAKYGWFELPVTNYEESGNYLIDKTDKSLYYAHHICPDLRYPSGKLMRNYTVCYSSEEHCPVWVAAPRHSVYQQKNCDRTNAYGKDPDVPSDIQYHSKDIGGGCNKGHMLGSAERLGSIGANRQVFYYTNIAPQNMSTFNTGGGAWNNLEAFVDGQVCSDTLYEVIGCYFNKFTDAYGKVCESKKIEFGDRSDVSWPSMFYYVLLRTKKGNTGKAVTQCSSAELQCVAFVVRHNMEKGHKPQAKDMMSVSDLEKLTGFTYFPNVPNAPKTTYTASDWL